MQIESKAKDIMTGTVLVADQDLTIGDAVKLLVVNKITGLPVVDDGGKMVGVLSEYDVIKNVLQKKKKSKFEGSMSKKISYSKKIEAVNEDAPLDEILELFIAKKCRRLPVLTKSKQLVGIITRRDVMRLLYYRSKAL